jgi:hypothetical protein
MVGILLTLNDQKQKAFRYAVTINSAPFRSEIPKDQW